MAEYPIAEETVGTPVLVILILLCIVIFIIIFKDQILQLLRVLVCSFLFWFPLGALAQAATQGCTAIPISI